MTKIRFNLRKVAAIAAFLASFSANSVLAQTAKADTLTVKEVSIEQSAIMPTILEIRWEDEVEKAGFYRNVTF